MVKKVANVWPKVANVWPKSGQSGPRPSGIPPFDLMVKQRAFDLMVKQRALNLMVKQGSIAGAEGMRAAPEPPAGALGGAV